MEGLSSLTWEASRNPGRLTPEGSCLAWSPLSTRREIHASCRFRRRTRLFLPRRETSQGGAHLPLARYWWSILFVIVQARPCLSLWCPPASGARSHSPPSAQAFASTRSETAPRKAACSLTHGRSQAASEDFPLKGMGFVRFARRVPVVGTLRYGFLTARPPELHEAGRLLGVGEAPSYLISLPKPRRLASIDSRCGRSDTASETTLWCRSRHFHGAECDRPRSSRPFCPGSTVVLSRLASPGLSCPPSFALPCPSLLLLPSGYPSPPPPLRLVAIRLVAQCPLWPSRVRRGSRPPLCDPAFVGALGTLFAPASQHPVPSTSFPTGASHSLTGERLQPVVDPSRFLPLVTALESPESLRISGFVILLSSVGASSRQPRLSPRLQRVPRAGDGDLVYAPPGSLGNSLREMVLLMVVGEGFP